MDLTYLLQIGFTLDKFNDYILKISDFTISCYIINLINPKLRLILYKNDRYMCCFETDKKITLTFIKKLIALVSNTEELQ